MFAETHPHPHDVCQFPTTGTKQRTRKSTI
jgi:hypothetical protein